MWSSYHQQKPSSGKLTFSVWSNETAICSTKLRVNLGTPAQKVQKSDPWSLRALRLWFRRVEGEFTHQFDIPSPPHSSKGCFLTFMAIFQVVVTMCHDVKAMPARSYRVTYTNHYHLLLGSTAAVKAWLEQIISWFLFFSPTIKYPEVVHPAHFIVVDLLSRFSNHISLTPPRWPGLGAGESNLLYPINSTTCSPRCDIIEEYYSAKNKKMGHTIR